jgi:outer membrane murein-binding lipoprotein Lpp
MRFDVYITIHDPAAAELLQQLAASVSELHRKVNTIMTDVATLKAQQAKLISDFDTETTAVATRLDKIQTDNAAAIKALQDQIAAGSPVTAQDLTDLGAGFDAMTPISARLKTLGADPAQPIPVDPNPPVAGTVG